MNQAPRACQSFPALPTSTCALPTLSPLLLSFPHPMLQPCSTLLIPCCFFSHDFLDPLSIPEEIGKLQQLELLSVSTNLLQYLPLTLCECENLQSILIKVTLLSWYARLRGVCLPGMEPVSLRFKQRHGQLLDSQFFHHDRYLLFRIVEIACAHVHKMCAFPDCCALRQKTDQILFDILLLFDILFCAPVPVVHILFLSADRSQSNRHMSFCSVCLLIAQKFDVKFRARIEI